MSRETDPCSCCGAPVRSAQNYGGTAYPRWVISWTCGRTSNYDGPGEPCPNRKPDTGEK
jgi:hypothetical protein